MRYLDQFITRSKTRIYREAVSRDAKFTIRIAAVIMSLAVITLFSIYRIDPFLEMTASIPSSSLRLHWASSDANYLPNNDSGNYDWFIVSDDAIAWDIPNLHRCLHTSTSPISVTVLTPTVLVASRAAVISCPDDTIACLRAINKPLECLTFTPVDLKTHRLGMSEILYNQTEKAAVAFQAASYPPELRCPRPNLPPVPLGSGYNLQVKVFVSGDASEARSSWGKQLQNRLIECAKAGCLDEVAHSSELDFAVVVESDTFVNVKNLMQMLSGIDPQVPVYGGHVMVPPTLKHSGECEPYMSPGAGFILSKASVKSIQDCDSDIHTCLAAAGILPQTGIEGLMQPLSHAELKSGSIPSWFKAYSFNETSLVAMDELVTFHFMNGRMHELIDSRVQF